MAGLIAKKLAQLPLGTSIELVYGDGGPHYEIVTGTITDSDSINIEITTETGEEVLLDYSIVRAIRKTAAVPVSQPVSQPSISPPPDPVSPPQERPKAEAVYQQNTDIATISVTDKDLKTLFSQILPAERKKLNGAYDSFKYGVKCTDRSKIAQAANAAQEILFDAYDDDYDWSSDAARFCGFLLLRSGTYQQDVFLIGRCFYEAAYCCYRNKDFFYAGVYALLALLEGDIEHIQDLLTILTVSSIDCDDASALHMMQDESSSLSRSNSDYLAERLLENKGHTLPAGQSADTLLTLLDELYPNTRIAGEAESWLSEGQTGEVFALPSNPEHLTGFIDKLRWVDGTGTICCSEDRRCPFQYRDISDPVLRKAIEGCKSTDLDGKIYWVKFILEGGKARKIEEAKSALSLAREAASQNQYQEAISQCKSAAGTPDASKALEEMVQYAIERYKIDGQFSGLEEVEQFYQTHRQDYPQEARALSALGQLYRLLKDFPAALEYTQSALSFDSISPKLKTTFLAQYIRFCIEDYNENPDLQLMEMVKPKADEWLQIYRSAELSSDVQCEKYYSRVLKWRLRAECAMDLLPEAEEDFEEISRKCPFDSKTVELGELLNETRKRLSRRDTAAVRRAVSEEAPPSPHQAGGDVSVVAQNHAAEEPDPAAGEEPVPEAWGEIDPIPYEDTDGWDALHLSRREVVNYALQIPGPDRVPAMLAYLRAGAALNPEIKPVYQVVALAANDPMERPDYSAAALTHMLDQSDLDYPQLTDCCMGAAFLRASFLSGVGYDYSTQRLRESIAVAQEIPALQKAYDLLEEFRTSAGKAIDRFADYQNRAIKDWKENIDAVVRDADELYTKFILTPPRESVKLARLLETKKLVFARDGYLAAMLDHIICQDREALDAEKDAFVSNYLNGDAQFSKKHINSSQLDTIITESWEQAGKSLQRKKRNTPLQGGRRNNLRSNMLEILEVICRWYLLCDQEAGPAGEAELGEELYQRLRPQLTGQFHEIHAACMQRIQESSCAEYQAGLFLLSETAQELSARLDGSWGPEQEKYRFVDFLRSDHVMLNADFMPELASTFCILPEFNILARIRRHVEEPKMSFQEHLDRIYSAEKCYNNYGSAEQIVQYFNRDGADESIVVPENAAQFVSQAKLQMDMQLRSFQENYALSVNRGQIMQTDAFCRTLEDTAGFWYAFCVKTKNYGFFIQMIQQAERQIHASARQYEQQLTEQLEGLTAGEPQLFEVHPEYAQAIRGQIAQQSFLVAEDWMNQVRAGNFSMEFQPPEALNELDRFWSRYRAMYDRAADSSRSLGRLLDRTDLCSEAQRLLDLWPVGGTASGPSRIMQLLNLFGWKNIQVSQCGDALDPKTELYFVTRPASAEGAEPPLHPIAAFGSQLAQDGMYIVCLYGMYDCSRLYEKIQALDKLAGNQVILLDCALGGMERRLLACQLKKRESGLKNVFLVIDRLLVCYLAEHYREDAIQQMLMAVGMPFSYCQPYAVDPSRAVPPEIFTGRKEELLDLKQPEGANLIYGGYQMGKSSLLKKAEAEINGSRQRRALLVDIKDCGCAAAAWKLSAGLIDQEILPGLERTEDWELLCREIGLLLQGQDSPVDYLLLMLDEADCFLEDCARSSGQPLVQLRELQQALPGRFKFVLASLRGMDRFNWDGVPDQDAAMPSLPSLKIGPFDLPEAQELLTRPLSYLGFSLPDKVILSQILAATHYVPGLIQLYGQKLIESVRASDYAGYDIKRTPPYVISDRHLRRVMADKEFVKRLREHFEITLQIDSRYSPLVLLIGLMSVQSPQDGYPAADVLSYARDLSVRPLAQLEEKQIQALLGELEELNILHSVCPDRYRLASKNIRDMLGSDGEILDKLSSLEVRHA